ncbi:PBP2a family beta-lactam-resistant peptidoglycan transpeptidase MecB [Macrococcoides canis]|uniref:Penicillin-binding protein 2' MecB-like protein n=1 Tax=Macrococcoides canis TaxID=1855823 RepID=A0A0D6DR33_9STAP|nr:PBP2a family beta-lactam-resistant peptidoglycan transpeptidase MecB [Macrococcus canis]ARQ05749.1 penicillin-binding protein 2' MecB-like protein [Macrococcus canis]WBF52867.1 PBP2a family beta-lactam-resistant peptidoglycan transpeptidase MecB [Macrococcus canis]CDO67671.1 penicillin-binding protein 2' homolog MecB [Macrococcus canis]
MKNKALAILIICICLLIAYNFVKKDEVDKIFDAIELRDSEYLNEHATFLSKSLYDKDQRYKRMDKIDASLGIKEVKVSNVRLVQKKKNKRQYSANLNFRTKYGNFSREGNYSFEKDEITKNWFLDWSPEVIIPGLTDRNQISIETLESFRGKILDRNGIDIAKDGIHYEVGIDIKNLNKKNKKNISKLLSISESTLNKKLKQTWVKEGVFVPLKSYIELDDELKLGIQKYHLTVNQTKGRVYPLREATVHLLGYVGEINAEELKNKKFKDYDEHSIVGKSGIELQYDKQLQNKDGYKVVMTSDDALNNDEDVLLEKKPKNGQDIILTIDSKVQRSIYSHLKEDNGSGVAMNPKTGELLALVSYPAYDPYEFMFGISDENYKKIVNDKKEPLLNKFQTTSSPGSTQKLITSIIGLKNGTIDASTNYNIVTKGWQRNASWGGYEVTRFEEVNGDIDLEKAIAHSDNIFFARATLDMGSEKFIKGMKALDIGRNIPSDYYFQKGQIANPESLKNNLKNEILLADSGYGQGEILISPVQILSIYSALINEGKMMKPKLFETTKEDIWKNHIISKDDVDILTRSMRKVVTGTHRLDAERNYAQFAGKTGTAELKTSREEGLGAQIGWFVGYDQNNPNMMLGISVKNVENRGMSSYNARKFAEIMDELYENGNKKYEIDR